MRLRKITTHSSIVSLDQSPLAIIALVESTRAIFWTIDLEHEMSAGIFGEDRWAHLLSDGMTQKLQERQRCCLSNVH